MGSPGRKLPSLAISWLARCRAAHGHGSSWAHLQQSCLHTQGDAALTLFKRCMRSWAATASGSSSELAGLSTAHARTHMRWPSMLVARLRSTMAPAAAAPAEAAAAARATAKQASLVGSEALTHGLSVGARTQLAWWLGGSAAWVYSMVVLGGITRLTRSGLSMTEWKFTGERPPMTQADWQAQYDKYRSSPEFKKLHASMTLEEFKFIFWMEYAHRMWGRLLGLAFVVPGSYFLARGYINGALGRRLGLLFAMGGTQGLVGWWMVRSGLEEPEHEWQTPRVSPYRLAAHLVSAFTIYSVMVWTTLDLLHPTPLLASASQAAQRAGRLVRSCVLPFSALVAVTATSGAFVAGMDAGRAFNTFPLMDGRWVPEEYWNPDTPGVRNFFENTAAVQWDHRVLALTTATAATALWPWVRASAVPPRAKLCMDIVMGVTALQVGLGIWTLLEYVPVSLGSAHQANALNLFTAVLLALHALRPAQPGPISQAVGRYGAPLAAAAVAAVGLSVTTQR